MSERWLPIVDVARRLGVTRQAVHKRALTGRLTVWTVNPRRGDAVVLERDVVAWERERTT